MEVLTGVRVEIKSILESGARLGVGVTKFIDSADLSWLRNRSQSLSTVQPGVRVEIDFWKLESESKSEYPKINRLPGPGKYITRCDLVPLTFSAKLRRCVPASIYNVSQKVSHKGVNIGTREPFSVDLSGAGIKFALNWCSATLCSGC